MRVLGTSGGVSMGVLAGTSGGAASTPQVAARGVGDVYDYRMAQSASMTACWSTLVTSRLGTLCGQSLIVSLMVMVLVSLVRTW